MNCCIQNIRNYPGIIDFFKRLVFNGAQKEHFTDTAIIGDQLDADHFILFNNHLIESLCKGKESWVLLFEKIWFEKTNHLIKLTAYTHLIKIIDGKINIRIGNSFFGAFRGKISFGRGRIDTLVSFYCVKKHKINGNKQKNTVDKNICLILFYIGPACKSLIKNNFKSFQ